MKKYINNLTFNYAISYSGLRGKKFDDSIADKMKSVKLIEKKLETARFMQKPKLRKEISEILTKCYAENLRVINKSGELHNSSEAKFRFTNGDKRIENILRILETEVEDDSVFMCAPVFRDAIVFYNTEDEITGIIHICFECSAMQNENEDELIVDYKVYDLIKNELKEIGHQID